MTDPTRLTKLPSSSTIKQAITSDDSAKPAAAEQKKTQAGISSVKDSFDVKKESQLFTANPNTGELNFGDGLSGKKPPVGQNITSTYNPGQRLLHETKAEISSYLKGQGGTASAEVGEPFRSMMEYLKLAQREAGEDRKMQRDSKESAMLAKEAKLNFGNKQIDEQMKEEGEKADAAMQAANTQLVMGIVGGLSSIGAAAASMKQMATVAKSEISEKSAAIEARYQRFNSLVNDLEKASETGSSKRLQQKANLQDIQTKKLEQAASKDEEAGKNSTAHRDRVRDAILDFLTKLRDMNPQI